MLNNLQYRTYQEEKQHKAPGLHLEASRIMYHRVLEMRKTAYEHAGISLACIQQRKIYPVRKEHRPSLTYAHLQVWPNVTIRVDLAFNTFSQHCKTRWEPDYPRFRE